jgi:hypothetical protein
LVNIRPLSASLFFTFLLQIPSFVRHARQDSNCDPRIRSEFEDFEGHLLRNFRKYAHRDVVERDSFWHWLSVTQHHGLPTRLFDWTYSPYAAVHFDTSDPITFDREAAIWAVNLVGSAAYR